ncbi:divergent polysaccharide deacetylase family protein [Sulfuricurvum sp.]|uniref:divergent polysaccharide deacetylase family protein n=1 Tax=Sulfuricurvum sp. TaxID=2025608 RepID=UPI0019C4D552|nr:divergent polysaccharide deacetylase family protein [Sulfuricurvum sp.]MBD3799428.1 divergent polysaccharide deacetylase family protein [Campylobacterota bacterium]MBD3805875.1 divergent polysaccharide deacetylase family protein [Sulfuricurvum sp.]
MNKRPRPNHIFSVQKIGWIIVVLLLFCIALLIGYVLGFSHAKEELAKEKAQTEKIKQIATIDQSYVPVAKSKDAAQEREIKRLKKELEEMLHKEYAEKNGMQEAVKPHHENTPKNEKSPHPPPPKRAIVSDAKGSKLVIIIDDVSYAHDVESLQSIGIPLVMSFLPPNSIHPESAKLARGYKHSMVHLPLEAVNFNNEEAMTLRVTDSEETIAKRISTLKQLYPNVRYMNNHTGSKFTADADAMERLIKVMKKEGLIFVDSRTTAKTKAPDVARKLGVRYIGRDVFLDHKDGVGNVKKQIQEAVAIAKRHGSAIAIGHPRPDTIKALRESKALLGEVQLVGIEQI